MSFNKIIIVGHLGRDPELRYTPQGKAVCSFSMATSDKRRDKSGEFQEVTTWFKVTLWDQKAEVASKYLTKGKQVYIEGRLRTEEWTDRDGNKRTSLEVSASDMQFIGAREGGGGGEYSGGRDEHDSEFSGAPQASSASSAGGGASSAPVSAPAADDDIPF